MKPIKADAKSVKKVLLWITLAFVLVFLFRFAYEVFFSRGDIVVDYSYNTPYASNYDVMDGEEKAHYRSSISGNIASEKIKQQDAATGQAVILDQKYEKTAGIFSYTPQFEQDVATLNTAIDTNKAVIQMEDRSGLEGSQRLVMTIGVAPDQFDSLVESIRSIGVLESFQVTKTDRTNQYHDLMAEQQTLLTTKKSYLAIKEKGGSIQDLLLLEEKILDIEQQLKYLGVDLGVFESESSFCTIEFSLRERAIAHISVRSMFSAAKDSFFWTLGAFALLLVIVIIALGGVTLLLLMIRAIQRPQPPQNPPYSSAPPTNEPPLPTPNETNSENSTDQNSHS